MAKIFQFDNSKVRPFNRAEPLDADIWFELNQHLLLWIIQKHRDGRKFFRLDQTDLPEIHEIRHNRLVRYVYEEVGKGAWIKRTTTDFRVGAKYANLINSQWNWFCELAREYYRATEKARKPIWNPLSPPVWMPAFQAGTTLTAYPDPSPETSTVDGQTIRITSSETWGDIIIGAGTHAFDDAANGTPGSAWADTVSDRWDRLYRFHSCYDTSSIDTDDIDDATLSLYGAGAAADPSGGDLQLDIVACTLASPTAVASTDHANIGGTVFGSVEDGSWNAAAYNPVTLDSNGESNINKSGISYFGARLNWDTDSSFGGTWGSGNVDSFTAEYADQTGETKDPKLVVNHSAASGGPANVKTYMDIASASVKTIDDIAIASVKSWNDIT